MTDEIKAAFADVHIAFDGLTRTMGKFSVAMEDLQCCFRLLAEASCTAQYRLDKLERTHQEPTMRTKRRVLFHDEVAG